MVASIGAADAHVQHAIVPPEDHGRRPYPFLLSVPRDYAHGPAAGWPLLMFLHGAGHGGENLWTLVTLGPPRLIEQGPDLSPADRLAAEKLTTAFVVVSPQSPAGERWDDERLLATLDFVLAKIKIDASRVYLTGASMGGFGTWMFATQHPDRVAAIVPVCGGGAPRDVTRATGERLRQLLRLGVWAFHNDRDPTVDVSASRAMVDAFKSIHARDVQLTIYPSNRHDAWTLTYRNLEVYDWLLRHQSPAAEANAVPRKSTR